MNKIDAFILFTEPAQAMQTVAELRQSESVDRIFLLTPEGITEQIEGCLTIPIDRLQSSTHVLKIAQHAAAPYASICSISQVTSRLLHWADDTMSGG